jgi:hypothetical protein
LSTGVVAFASIAMLVAAGCSGEQAFMARDGSAPGGSGGKGGRGGSGAGNIGGGGSGVAGDGDGGSASNTGGGGEGGSGSGVAGSGGAGAAGGAGRGGSGGASATGGTGNVDAGTDRAVGTGALGSTCATGGDCMSTYCSPERVCCDQACTGTCMTCVAPTNKGKCVPADNGDDPRNECVVQLVDTCGTTGVCNGSGACRVHAAGLVCNPNPTCDTNNASVIPSRICNGTGACVPNTPVSCHGFPCAAGACGTSCATDAACVPGAFCSAGTCVTGPPNIVSNGDLESGAATGWSVFGGASTMLAISSVAAGGFAHAGQYSVGVSNRSQYYQGPGYNLPTGVGKYNITGWGMQREAISIGGLLQVRLLCAVNTSPGYYHTVQPSGFGVAMDTGVWTMFSATIDTAQSPSGVDCLPTGATPGLVRAATVYLNQYDDMSGAPKPALYLDDVVVTVTDGHNLVGNPNFEAGVPDGWSVSAGSATPMISTTVFRGGAKSFRLMSRTLPSTGPKWSLPTGAARYNFSFWVQHAGAVPRTLTLQPTYTCVGGSAVTTLPAIATAMDVMPNTWTELKGMGVFPPANAAAGCKLLLAGVHVQHDGSACGTGGVECPDLFVDDVSVTLVP